MAHLDRVPNLGNQERTAVCRNVSDSQCLFAAPCKRRMCKGEKRSGLGPKKKAIPGEFAPPIALCVAGVTAGPGVISPPRAFVPSAHSAAPKAQRLQQHNTIMAKKKNKIPVVAADSAFRRRWQLSPPPQHSRVTVNGNFMLFFLFFSLPTP